MICSIDLLAQRPTIDDLIEGVEVVPSGVGELSRLQEAGYAYLKP